MNWFERYGIVGGYFLFIFIGWLLLTSNISDISNIRTGIELSNAIFAAASILPFGYLISILSQFLYYWRFGGRQIHVEIGEMIRRNSNCQSIINLDAQPDEATNESIITFFVRMLLFKCDDLKNFKYLAKFTTRRFDVISINNSIILATFLAPIASFIAIMCLRESLQGIFFNYNQVSLISASFFSCLVLLVAKLSNNILNKQIISVNKEIFYCRHVPTSFEVQIFNKIIRVRSYLLGTITSLGFFVLYSFLIKHFVNKG